MIVREKKLVFVLALVVASCLWHQGRATELSFELPDRDKQCFYEEIEKGTKCTLEFQVVSGGNYDVDCELKGPGGMGIYKGQRKQYDSIDFDATEAGEYSFCFSNEFSSYTHKLVYFDFIVGDEAPLTDDIGAQQTALTQLETSAVRIHEALRIVKDYQTHHRMRESQGRDTAEYLGERVQYWSLGETLLFVFIGLTQVFVLRRFFAGRKSTI